MRYVLINRHPAVFPTNCREAGLRAYELYVLHLPKFHYQDSAIQWSTLKQHDSKITLTYRCGGSTGIAKL